MRDSTRMSSVPDVATAEHNLWDECTNPLLAQIDRFVLFGDLHVSDATLPTCLDALSLVQQACKRHSTCGTTGKQKDLTAVAAPCGEVTSDFQEPPAAAVFLGDFWHSRIERHLHWGLLRPVLEFWEQWDIPVVLLPGNHDQLSYEAGRDLLQPLEKAASRSPLVLALRRPTLINKELLFVPHIRETSKLQRIMVQAKQCKTLRAVFGHMSVRGASLCPFSEEGGTLLNDGIDIELLPDVRVYSGHIHTPQLVGKQVRYVGSLYQTSLAEAYQRKCLYTISRSCGFEVVEVQESPVGPRHFPVRDPRQLPPPKALRRGDRVILLPSTPAAAEPPCSQTAVSSPPPDGRGEQPPTQQGTNSTAESMQNASVAFTDIENSMLEAVSEGDHANSRRTRCLSTNEEAGSGLGIAFSENVMTGGNELNAEQLLEISEAYREAGILFDCRINPLAPASSLSRQASVSVGKEKQETLTTLNEDSPGMARPAAMHSRNGSAEVSHVAEERTTKTAPDSFTDSEFLLPDALTSPLRLLMHHGLIPVENRPPLAPFGSTCANAVWFSSKEATMSEREEILPLQTALVTGVVCDDVPSISSSKCSSAESFMGDGRNAEEVPSSLNPEDRFASVELEGAINGQSFYLRRRRWRSGRSELTLHVGGKDMTAQSAADTQRELELLFGGRLKAWSQFIYLSSHGADGLLGTSEASFSALLTLLFPLDVWIAATAAVRSKQRILSKAAEALDLVAAVRLRDLQRIVGKNRLSYVPPALKTGFTVGVPPCGEPDSAPCAKPPSPTVASKDDDGHAATSNSREDAQPGDAKGAAFTQARRLQKLISRLRSRAAFYRSQKAVLEEVEQHLGPQGIQRHLLAERTIQQASSGQRQLLGLCLYLAFVVTLKRRAGLRCNILLLDEPFLSLDCVNKQRVLELLRSLVGDPRGSQLAEFESIFLTQHDLRPRKWRHILDAVDTIAIHNKSGHRGISTSVFLKRSKKAVTGAEPPRENTAQVKVSPQKAADNAHQPMEATR
ncbi:hypothetical protein, conserved [Eimeria praecox]|uniref:Calcineurin-like phosphoesterase domain-containing protein n=1 Tax=Eimeria praecox TaxID=51316 RepID=U6GVX2_9EIME|nr:hypothetical protein, conserved [Eimeria praecox]